MPHRMARDDRHDGIDHAFILAQVEMAFGKGKNMGFLAQNGPCVITLHISGLNQGSAGGRIGWLM